MTTLEHSPTAPARENAFSANALPLLSQMPRLLEYRGEEDPDVEFIPKTIAGFAMGSMAMFLTLILADALFLHKGISDQSLFGWKFAFAIGIIGVSCSLLLVGVKVRADHSAVQLFAKHWLNSIGTGAIYSLMVWTPWVVMNQFHVNKFLAAAVWMGLMAFPAIAAKWVIGPHTPLTTTQK